MGRPKKTVADILNSGNPSKLSQAELARRLALEQGPAPVPGAPERPAGLNTQERRAWAALMAELDGKLFTSDVPVLMEAARIKAALPGLKKQDKAGVLSTDDYNKAVAKLEKILLPLRARCVGAPPAAPVAAAATTAGAVPDCAACALQYANDLVNGVIPAGKLAILAAKRYLADLQDGPARGFTFSAAAAQRPVDFLYKLRIGDLLGWQCFVIAACFGFLRADGTRRVHSAYIEVAKKNGKSTLLAGLALYMAAPADIGGDGELRPQVYCAATTRFQAADICFKEALRLRENYSELAAITKTYKAGAIEFETHGTLQALAANSERLNGLNIHCGILDELGDHPTPDLYNVFFTSTVNRRSPLTLAITTAAAQRAGNIAWEQRCHGEQVLERTIEDDSVFCFICSPDPGDRWDDESIWIKSNPSLGVLVQVQNLREACNRAKLVPSAKHAFLRYNLDIWPSTSVAGWIDVEDLRKQGCAYLRAEDKAKGAVTRINDMVARLRGQKCFLGLDLALTRDLSVLSFLFPPPNEEGIFEALFRVYCPHENIVERTREQRVPYQQWESEKLITATPGEVTDFAFIERDILEARQSFQVQGLFFDVALAQDMVLRLRDKGLVVTRCDQGFGLSPAIQRLERLIKIHKLHTGGHPIFEWCAANAVLNHGVRDVRFDKSKAREKIDAAVALAMSMDGYLKTPKPVTPRIHLI